MDPKCFGLGLMLPSLEPLLKLAGPNVPRLLVARRQGVLLHKYSSFLSSAIWERMLVSMKLVDYFRRYLYRYSMNLAFRVCCRSLSTKAQKARRQVLIDKIIRVDHAGELGADRIYAGQFAVLGSTAVGPIIKEMWEEEKHHLETFEKLMVQHRARPTALVPFWNIAGFVLGAGTALLGREGAMACTVAVEEVIGEHYNDQLRQLMEDGPENHRELMEIIKKFRDDELHHYETGLEHDALKAPFYSTLTQLIKFGCHGAIWISERV